MPLHCSQVHISEKPATTALIIFCVAVWLLARCKKYGFSDVSDSYKEAFDTRLGAWKITVFQLMHLNFRHLFLNMLCCWLLGAAESVLGTWYYITMSAFMLDWVACAQVAAHYATKASKEAEEQQQQEETQDEKDRLASPIYALGYSGVTFGWLACLITQLSVSFSHDGQPLSRQLLPWGMLVVAVCSRHIVPRAVTGSWLGDCAGIAAGIMVGLGIFDFLQGYLGMLVVLHVGISVLLGLWKEGLLGWSVAKGPRSEDEEQSLLPT